MNIKTDGLKKLEHNTEFCVIGGGLAGMVAAISAAISVPLRPGGLLHILGIRSMLDILQTASETVLAPIVGTVYRVG